MNKVERKYSCVLGTLLFGAVSSVAQAVALDGRLYLDGYITNEDGYYADGSYFAMGANNPNGNAAGLQPAAAGGYIELGTFQGFVTTPDVPHPQGWQGDTNGDGIPDGNAGTGYTGVTPASTAMFNAFSFFGVATHVGTLPVSYQTGLANVAPTADVDLTSCTGSVCAMTADLSSWEVYWNGSTFQQGPRPSNVGPFVLAQGTFDLSTNHYEFTWASQIKQGPFNGVTGYWHIEGEYVGNAVVPVPAAFWLFGSGLLALAGFVRSKK